MAKKNGLGNVFKGALAFGGGFALGNVLISIIFVLIGAFLYSKGSEKEKNGEGGTMKMVGIGCLVVGAGPFILSNLDGLA